MYRHSAKRTPLFKAKEVIARIAVAETASGPDLVFALHLAAFPPDLAPDGLASALEEIETVLDDLGGGRLALNDAEPKALHAAETQHFIGIGVC